MAKSPKKAGKDANAAVRAAYAVKHDGERYENGDDITGLTDAQAHALVASGHTRLDSGEAEAPAEEKAEQQ